MSFDSKARRFGWVDWLLLLLLCGLVFVGVYYWKIRQSSAWKSVEIAYVLCVSGLEERKGEVGAASLVEVGGAVMNQNGTIALGRVLSVQARPVWRAVVANEAVEFVPVPNKKELLITVQASATQKEGDGFRVGDIRIAVGKQGDFRIGRLFAAGASIVRIEEAQA